ncbi:hypothetical protein PIB30_029034 [Stylosanthes scabra]|uniref:Uncharacterized protein n=1 Tax=Stylosanthes scabra TaxID=79078 RepID=A0ABU6ZAB2_9FABA|nr:hypothetical protein [Stylosanthes scabra]
MGMHLLNPLPRPPHADGKYHPPLVMNRWWLCPKKLLHQVPRLTLVICDKISQASPDHVKTQMIGHILKRDNALAPREVNEWVSGLHHSTNAERSAMSKQKSRSCTAYSNPACLINGINNNGGIIKKAHRLGFNRQSSERKWLKRAKRTRRSQRKPRRPNSAPCAYATKALCVRITSLGRARPMFENGASAYAPGDFRIYK